MRCFSQIALFQSRNKHLCVQFHQIAYDCELKREFKQLIYFGYQYKYYIYIIEMEFTISIENYDYTNEKLKQHAKYKMYVQNVLQNPGQEHGYGTCYQSPSIDSRLEIEEIFLFIQSHSLVIYAQCQCLLLAQDVGNERSRSIWKYPSLERSIYIKHFIHHSKQEYIILF
ncbi:Hypothetical_protein [Hexamita inflata]|uniref:Hypothetical_protein n=1 Tax=Hexamita inflata TaxID=28002 RepID=A0AA86VT83_9EUKA|nr:Hypothetical protein HINF_LOCUS64773 [Hexamita inflata]